MTRTKATLFAAALAITVPTTLALSQDRQDDANRQNRGQDDSGQTVLRGQDQRPGSGQLNGRQQEQLSPEQAKQMTEKWFKHAASGNQFEIEAGKLAQERLQNEQLKQHVQMIVQDHQQANQALRQHAEQAGVQISETPELMPVHKAKLEELREKQGQDFERCFVFGQAAGHTYSVLEYSWAAEKGFDPHVKEYARATLPKIQQHAQQIAPIAYAMAGIENARTAGGRIGDEQPGQNQDRRDDRGNTDRPRGGGR